MITTGKLEKFNGRQGHFYFKSPNQIRSLFIQKEMADVINT